MKRYIPTIIFAITATVGVLITFAMFRAEATAEYRRFEVVADDAVDRISEQISRHITLLDATRAFFAANRSPVTRSAFSTFIQGLVLSGQFEGLRGIGYARLMAAGDEKLAEEMLQRNYGIGREVWPETEQNWRAPIVLLEPDDTRNKAALGYDMYSEARRRAAMRGAIATGRVSASAPVELVQEITRKKQTGFLVYIPFKAAGPAVGTDNEGAVTDVTGFVYAPFRAGDLHLASLLRRPKLPVLVETVDSTDGEIVPLYRSPGYVERQQETANVVHRSIDVAGRKWTISVVEDGTTKNTLAHWRTFMLAAVSLLFAAALAVSARSRLKAVAAVRQLAEISEQTIREKDLMLQEMKHRIKNSIARIAAMSRQTAAGSEDLEAFNASFSARLQAMANAQELLTHSAWQKAELHALLKQELQQVFGEELDGVVIDGPSVALDEKTAHALGLVIHELATNAMKYGCMSNDGGSLSVTWTLETSARTKKFTLEWAETSRHRIAPCSEKGFGTRLIDASIAGELGGSVERNFEPRGLTVRLVVPLA